MRVGGGIPHRMVASRIELYPFCRSAIILQMATSDPIPLGPVAKCRQVRSLRGVHWDNAHQYNINEQLTYPKLSVGINHTSGERAKASVRDRDREELARAAHAFAALHAPKTSGRCLAARVAASC